VSAVEADDLQVELDARKKKLAASAKQVKRGRTGVASRPHRSKPWRSL
jgi:hypothetical protein